MASGNSRRLFQKYLIGAAQIRLTQGAALYRLRHCITRRGIEEQEQLAHFR